MHTIPDTSLDLHITRWNLEHPAKDGIVEESRALEVRGWALAPAKRHALLHVVLQFKTKTLSFPMNIDRPDVVQTVLGQEPKDHPQLKCGFRYAIAPSDASDGFTVGFETDLEIHPAIRLEAV